MKSKIGMYGETPRVKIGRLTICQQDGDDDSKGIWIEDGDDDGGVFKTESVEKVLKAFYDKNL